MMNIQESFIKHLNRNKRTEWTTIRLRSSIIIKENIDDRDEFPQDDKFWTDIKFLNHDEQNLVEALSIPDRGGDTIVSGAMYSAERIYYTFNSISEMIAEIPKRCTGTIEQLLCAMYIGRLWEFNGYSKAVEVIEDVQSK